MRGITRDCVVEMFDRKIWFIFALVTLFTIIAIALSGTMDFKLSVQTNENLDLQQINNIFGDPLMRSYSLFLSFLIFLTVLATSGLIPNMLKKGRAEFYLSKPLSRNSLLLNKLFGIWFTYGSIIVLCSVFVWATMYLIYGFFDWHILYILISGLVVLFLWLSIIVFTGIIFRTNALVLMTVFIVWVIQYILKYHESISAFFKSKQIGYVVDTLYYIIPKTSKIADIAFEYASKHNMVSWEPLYSSLLFVIILLFVTSYVFKRISY